MKKIVFIGIGVAVILAYSYYLHGIDTRYAVEYSKVFSSYDINQVDKYLNEETVISHNGVSKKYKVLRDNVIIALKKKQFKMVVNSSYGHRTNSFFSKVYKINIQSYVEHNNVSLEVPITLQLEIEGFNKFSVKSLRSNHDFFGYLFFGIVK